MLRRKVMERGDGPKRLVGEAFRGACRRIRLQAAGDDRQGRARPHVTAACQRSHTRFAALYEKLTK